MAFTFAGLAVVVDFGGLVVAEVGARADLVVFTDVALAAVVVGIVVLAVFGVLRGLTVVVVDKDRVVELPSRSAKT